MASSPPTRACGSPAGADVYAVGDASWFPIKQGGLAAQQADVAATAIAAGIDSDLEDEPFRPELRAALLTADGPIYLRAGAAAEPEAVSDAPLWWPPGKVAGRLLAPFIAYQARRVQPAAASADRPRARLAGRGRGSSRGDRAGLHGRGRKRSQR